MSANKAVRIIVQWLLIPIVMAALGFFLIGPRLGQSPTLEAKAEAVQELVKNASPIEPDIKVTEEPEAEPEKFGDLDIHVLKPGEKPPKKEEPEEEPTAEPEEQTTEPESTESDSTEDEEPPVTTDEDLIPVTPPANTGGL